MSFAVYFFQTSLLLAVLILVATTRSDEWNGDKSEKGDNLRSISRVNFPRRANDLLSSLVRSKRDPEHYIDDCMYMTSEDGEFFYKAMKHPDGIPCGMYFYAEPDENIEIRFNYLDVTCDNGGLVAIVDGWELNGEIFPNPEDHQKPLKARFTEICGRRKVKQVFVSSQNVALIQHRMPARGASFSVQVRFVKNPIPCNVFLQSDQIFTLHNFEKRSNCSISSLFPAAVKVLSINVGITPSRERGVEFETGTIHKCQKRGLDDYLQIGGSLGLDNGNMKIADSICGLDSKPSRHVNYIACETTSSRLVSSGAFDNSVTVAFTRLTEENMNVHMNLVCAFDDMPAEQ